MNDPGHQQQPYQPGYQQQPYQQQPYQQQAPYGPGYQQQPYYPQQPPKRRSKVGIVLGVVGAAILVFCGIGIVVSILSAGEPGSPGNGGGVTVGMNQPARDGNFEFTVTSIECGLSQVGSGMLVEQAQGQFCLVRVTVANIGDTPRTFTSVNQHAYNAAGQRYDPDSGAAIYLDDLGNAFLEEINPGNSVNGVLVFDIPADAAIAKLELHDSAFSGGVTVTIS